MMNEKHFEKQKLNHNLFCDDSELYRQCTRINTKKLQFLQKQPILVCIDSYFTKLLIWNCHEDEHHCRVESIIRLLKEDKLCNGSLVKVSSVKFYKVKHYCHLHLRSFLSIDFILSTILRMWSQIMLAQILYTHIYMCSYTEYSSRIGTVRIFRYIVTSNSRIHCQERITRSIHQ